MVLAGTALPSRESRNWDVRLTSGLNGNEENWKVFFIIQIFSYLSPKGDRHHFGAKLMSHQIRVGSLQ